MKDKKIIFAADNHYGIHGGRVLYNELKDDFNIDFFEDCWSCFDKNNFSDLYDLMILNLISGTCDIPSPTLSEMKNIQLYLESGKPVFLLHGASAAFWQWSWWREIVGFRWVRDKDPDGVKPSVHPICAYDVKISKVRHLLSQILKPFSIQNDELYTELEQTCAATILMEAYTKKNHYPVCYETQSNWTGKIITYIPGHYKNVILQSENIYNCKEIIKYLLSSSK